MIDASKNRLINRQMADFIAKPFIFPRSCYPMYHTIHADVYSIRHISLSDVKHPSAAQAYVIFAFASITWYNSLELVVLCFITFKRYHGCYFWSLLVSSICLTPNSLGFVLYVFTPQVPDYLSVAIFNFGWCGMITGQSLVLWSRLHLIHRNRKHVRGLLWMIITNAVLLHTTTTVLIFGAVSPHHTRFNHGYDIIERIQLVIFCIQELILSVIYIWDTVKLLKLRPGGWHKKILMELLIINCIILILDIAVVATEYSGLLVLQVTLKSAVYSVKLKLEYAILGKLIRISKAPRDISELDSSVIGSTSP